MEILESLSDEERERLMKSLDGVFEAADDKAPAEDGATTAPVDAIERARALAGAGYAPPVALPVAPPKKPEEPKK